MKLSEAVARVIGFAKALRDYWETELPKRHPNYPVMNPGEQALPPPPEEKKLAKLFASLPEDTVYQIALLMYLGRGDFDVRELADHYKALKDNFDSASALALQLTDKAPLADYLQDGLAELKKHNIDADRLPMKPTRASQIKRIVDFETPLCLFVLPRDPFFWLLSELGVPPSRPLRGAWRPHAGEKHPPRRRYPGVTGRRLDDHARPLAGPLR